MIIILIAPTLSTANKKTTIKKSSLVSDITFVAFDTETTGINPKKDRIVEVGAVKFRSGIIIEEKSWLINPKRKIPHRVQKVHGITHEMVKDSPSFVDIYPEFKAFIKGSVLLAHNARFDVSFVGEEIKRNKQELPNNDVLDSLRLFRKWFPKSKPHSLSALADYAKIGEDPNHRALADSIAVALIFEKGIKTKRLSKVYKDAGGALRF